MHGVLADRMEAQFSNQAFLPCRIDLHSQSVSWLVMVKPPRQPLNLDEVDPC